MVVKVSNKCDWKNLFISCIMRNYSKKIKLNNLPYK